MRIHKLASAKLIVRPYQPTADYQRVDNFLIQHYQPNNADGNWLQPAWEYMHAHPYLDQSFLNKIGVWEDEGTIVAVVHYESRLGEAFFEFHPKYRHLKKDLLDYAEKNLSATTTEGKKYLHAFVPDLDDDFTTVVTARGYEKNDDEARVMCQYAIPDPFPAITLPDGFRLTSLAKDCDWAKVHRVLWRGFNHQGEPPAGESELESRRKLFDTPTARRELKIAVEAPDGNFVSFCGMFYEPHTRYAYVEPVATDPDYRRLGLAKAAILEGLRRCAKLGATMAYVGNDLPVYRALGFEKAYTLACWTAHFGENSPTAPLST